MFTGSHPFFNPILSTNSLWAVDDNVTCSELEFSGHWLDSIDTELRNHWYKIKRFCSLMNIAANQNHKFSENLLVEATTSLTYPLLHMGKFQLNTVNEVVRLGSLAFLLHVFLQWHSIKPPPSSYFVTRYKQCLINIQNQTETLAELSLWVLIIGKMALFDDTEDAWIKQTIAFHLQVHNYKPKLVHDALRSHLWIGFLHDNQSWKITQSASNLAINLKFDTSSLESKVDPTGYSGEAE